MSDVAYEVQYAERYEPWVVCDRAGVPWHDGAFKGYGLNKILHLEHLRAGGYRFVVHPSAFLLHRPHHATKAKKMVLEEKRRRREHADDAIHAMPGSAQQRDHDDILARGSDGESGGGGSPDAAPISTSTYGHTQALGEQARRDLAAGAYRPRVDRAVSACLATLPWWQR